MTDECRCCKSRGSNSVVYAPDIDGPCCTLASAVEAVPGHIAAVAWRIREKGDEGGSAHVLAYFFHHALLFHNILDQVL